MAIIYNGTNILDINYNGTAVDVVIYNGVEVWRREEPTPPPTPVDVWTITWNDNIECEEVEEEEVIWTVLDDTLSGLSYTSNGGTFNRIYADDEGSINYNNTLVYEASGGVRKWSYENPNYKVIKMYVDPETVFVDDWAHFLETNGTVVHTIE